MITFLTCTLVADETGRRADASGFALTYGRLLQSEKIVARDMEVAVVCAACGRHLGSGAAGKRFTERDGGAGCCGAHDGEFGVVAENTQQQEALIHRADVKVARAAFVAEALEGGLTQTPGHFPRGMIGSGGEGGGFTMVAQRFITGVGVDDTAFLQQRGIGGVRVGTVQRKEETQPAAREAGGGEV